MGYKYILTVLCFSNWVSGDAACENHTTHGGVRMQLPLLLLLLQLTFALHPKVLLILDGRSKDVIPNPSPPPSALRAMHIWVREHSPKRCGVCVLVLGVYVQVVWCVSADKYEVFAFGDTLTNTTRSLIFHIYIASGDELSLWGGGLLFVCGCQCNIHSHSLLIAFRDGERLSSLCTELNVRRANYSVRVIFEVASNARAVFTVCASVMGELGAGHQHQHQQQQCVDD